MKRLKRIFDLEKIGLVSKLSSTSLPGHEFSEEEVKYYAPSFANSYFYIGTYTGITWFGGTPVHSTAHQILYLKVVKNKEMK